MRINILYYFSLGLFGSADLFVSSSLFASFVSTSLSFVSLSLSSLDPDPEESSLIQLLYKTVLPVKIVTTLVAVSKTF
jgi:hypothetical protein